MIRAKECLLLLVVWLAVILPAAAHKAKCFAAVEGDRISGYAWLGGGSRPKNVPFKVLAPDGEVLQEGTTNEEGEFSFRPTRRCDHRIVVLAGEGHEAQFTVAADELPLDPADAPSAADIEQAVSRQIAPLRRELAAFRDRQRLQDVLAGIGYIAGLAGVTFYFLGVRRRERLSGRGSQEHGPRGQDRGTP